MIDNAPKPHPQDAPRKRRNARWITIALAVGLAAGAYGFRDRIWAQAQSTATTVPLVPQSIPVTTVHAEAIDLAISKSGLGTVTPIKQVDVKVRVDGQIQKLAFAEGQSVKAGDVLAQIDPRPYKALLAQAEATLQKDMAQRDNAKADEARATRLKSLGAGTSQAADTARSHVATLDATIQGDQAAVDTAKLNLGYATVTAPFDGRVGLTQLDEGTIIRASDATGLVTITQMQPIAVQFSLPQDNLPDLIAGQATGAVGVSVDTTDGSRHLANGKLTVIDSQVDTATGMVKLQAEFDNADGTLWPGALVTAHIVVRTDNNTTVVPSIAVQNGQKGSYVYQVKPDNSVTSIPVVIGPVVGDLTAVNSGIAPGDNIVLSGQSRLADGTKVKVTQSDMPSQKVALEAN